MQNETAVCAKILSGLLRNVADGANTTVEIVLPDGSVVPVIGIRVNNVSCVEPSIDGRYVEFNPGMDFDAVQIVTG